MIEKNNNINKYFDYIYCLNLDKRKDKLESVFKRFEHHGIHANRFSAINGNTKKNIQRFNKIIEKYGIKAKRLGKKTLRSPGALGCLLSYREIIRHAKKNKYKRILIFEDDVIFSKNFNKEFLKISKITDNWKLLYLGASQYDWSEVKKMQKPFYKACNSQGTFALAIDHSIFDEILIITKDLRIPIDSYLAVKIQRKYKNKCFVFYPNIVIADVSNSDIRNNLKNTRSHAKTMRWKLNRYQLGEVCNG